MNNINQPKHVAIIMDGNGRWAKQQGKLRITGHRAGAKSVKEIVKAAVKRGINVLTLYAFSSENWRRPATEVSALMELFLHALKNETPKLHKNNIRLRIIGDTSAFSERLQHQITMAEELTANNSGLILNIAANYGGRWDITQAVNRYLASLSDSQINSAENASEPVKVTDDIIDSYLSLSGLPDVDLLIRTGGDHRVSNFLLWQIAYAELYFTDCLWPDFNEHEFELALEDFVQRERRFGGI